MSARVTAVWALALLCVCVGCNVPGYWADRGRDAADVFTLTIGRGGDSRPGPHSSTSILRQFRLLGLRGGKFFYVPSGQGMEAPNAMCDFCLPAAFFPIFDRFYADQPETSVPTVAMGMVH